ncbi:MAG: hypothetical protein IKB25_05615 [Lentisphaeria bacterium]|nr:hypothetical protein [Lentisphaeria bacterium]
MPTWLIVILAIAAGIGMAVAAKKKEDPKFKPLAAVCVLVLLVCAFMHIDNQIGVFGESKEVRDQQSSAARFSEARIKALCEYVKSKNPGTIVIIPSGGTNYAKNEYTMKQVELVKKYIGNAEVKPVEYTRTEEEMAMNPMPTAKEWNSFFKANPDANLFIVLEQLPMGQEILRLDIFKKKGKQKLALMDMGDPMFVKPFFSDKAGNVVLVSINGKPGLKQEDYEKLAPSDLDEAFKMRYELVTKDNVDSIK